MKIREKEPIEDIKEIENLSRPKKVLIFNNPGE